GESMAGEARRLRNHPSVIAFLIGSDYAPPARIEKIYVDALRDNDWPNPIIASASERGAPPLTGRSGLKMRGPYDWVPPGYWYEDTQLGGAFGFNSETSAGNDIPTLDSLKKLLSPAELQALWQNPYAEQYHASPPGSPFATLQLFDVALAQRYGPPRSLADYVEKAQL